MATIASLVGNPILLRNSHPKFSAANLSACRHASFVPISSSSPHFNADLKYKSRLFSAAENNPKVLGRLSASLCKPLNAAAIIDHSFGNIGKPLGRVGGNWTTKYLYDPNSRYPRGTGVPLSIFIFCVFLVPAVCQCDLPWWHNALFLIISAVLLGWLIWVSERTTVVKLQVGFSGKGRDIGFDLNQIAQSADTSTYKGMTYVLDETILALLGHCEYCNSASISVVSKFGREAANVHIDSLSFEERANNKVTLVNVNNMKLQIPTSQKSANDRHNDDTMVTLLVGVEWGLKLPNICNKIDLQNVLHELRPYATSDVLTAVETLWTPQVYSYSVATNTGQSPKFLSDELSIQNRYE